MGWESAVVWVAIGIWAFLVFGLPEILKIFSNNKVKVAEANARTEEARLEQKKLDYERNRS
jgi:hypothetical protein